MSNSINQTFTSRSRTSSLSSTESCEEMEIDTDKVIDSDIEYFHNEYDDIDGSEYPRGSIPRSHCVQSFFSGKDKPTVSFCPKPIRPEELICLGKFLSDATPNWDEVEILCRHNLNFHEVFQEISTWDDEKKILIGKFLVSNHGNIDAPRINGVTLLFRACLKGNLKLTQLLIKMGANVNFRKASPSNTTEFYNPIAQCDTILKAAMESLNLEVVKAVLENKPHIIEYFQVRCNDVINHWSLSDNYLYEINERGMPSRFDATINQMGLNNPPDAAQTRDQTRLEARIQEIGDYIRKIANQSFLEFAQSNPRLSNKIALSGYTPLLVSVRSLDFPVTHFFLENGADPTWESSYDRETAFDLIKNDLGITVSNLKLRILHELLLHSYALNSHMILDNICYAPHHEDVDMNVIAIVIDKLKEQGAQLTGKNLIFAIEQNNMALVNYLRCQGIDLDEAHSLSMGHVENPNLRISGPWTPLEAACYIGNVEISKYLLRHGAQAQVTRNRQINIHSAAGIIGARPVNWCPIAQLEKFESLLTDAIHLRNLEIIERDFLLPMSFATTQADEGIYNYQDVLDDSEYTVQSILSFLHKTS